MTRRIPPLNPLHVFHTVAQTGSLGRAAAALGVTASAVSRQLSALEAYLGVPLFRRERQGVVLTEKGRAYRADVALAFRTITEATERIAAGEQQRPLRVRVRSTFTVKWLIPRLPAFHARYPAIDVSFVDNAGPVDLTRGDVDVAILFGDGQWPGCDTQHLLNDVIQPICSPHYLEANGALGSVDELANRMLIYSHNRHDDWLDWFDGIGRPELRPRRHLELATSLSTYEAATSGLGIAVGQVGLLDIDFAAGALVPLFNLPVVRNVSYYAVWRKDDDSLRVRSFISWLRLEAATPRCGVSRFQ